jgi:thiosulfate/3-mercaptopyruvate sulfurtransferase
MVEARSAPQVLLEPADLAAIEDGEDVLVVDLRKLERYLEGHIPGAVHLDTKALVCGIKPAVGKLPDAARLGAALAAIGLTSGHHVVAYDDEGGGWAGRLFWTLEVIGHPRASVLNGGVSAWIAEGHPLTRDVPARAASDYRVGDYARSTATRDEILSRLGDPSMALLDARTAEEYNGTRVRAARGGHIPGAANLDWKDTMDGDRHHRLLPDDVLRAKLSERGIGPDKQVVVYCHTHHRSSHSYLMLRHLGYADVKGYDGSWSEWGNDPDTPVES